MPVPPPSSTAVTFADIAAARERLRGIAHETPVMTSSTLNRLAGCDVYCKCENFQRTGSFKIRGAYNAIRQLPANARGVVSGSSGNHAQAVALAAKLVGMPSVIVMPHDAVPAKLAATKEYGAEVVFYDRATEAREDVIERVREERGYAVVYSHNHPHTIAGQGTVALELHRQIPDLYALVVPVSGGGLMTGCAVASSGCGSCRVVGVEPETANDFHMSLATGGIVRIANAETIADSLRCPSPGPYTFALARRYIKDIALVSDVEIMEALEFLRTRMKLVVEPGGAVGIAALLHRKIPGIAGERVGVVLSGGNAA